MRATDCARVSLGLSQGGCSASRLPGWSVGTDILDVSQPARTGLFGTPAAAAAGFSRVVGGHAGVRGVCPPCRRTRSRYLCARDGFGRRHRALPRCRRPLIPSSATVLETEAFHDRAGAGAGASCATANVQQKIAADRSGGRRRDRRCPRRRGGGRDQPRITGRMCARRGAAQPRARHTTWCRTSSTATWRRAHRRRRASEGTRTPRRPTATPAEKPRRARRSSSGTGRRGNAGRVWHDSPTTASFSLFFVALSDDP